MLLQKCKEIVKPKKFEIEYLTMRFSKSKGKMVNVLWLPVGHSELNPVRLIWLLFKSYVARENTTFEISGVKKLLEELEANKTRGNWKEAVLHTRKIGKALYEVDLVRKVCSKITKVIILLNSELYNQMLMIF